MVAEDEQESDMFIQAVIKIFGKEIFTAETGIEAREICRNNPGIDLVLMDIQMPEMDGYEAIRQIRMFNKEKIIIAQTAYGLSGDRSKNSIRHHQKWHKELLNAFKHVSFKLESLLKHFPPTRHTSHQKA